MDAFATMNWKAGINDDAYLPFFPVQNLSRPDGGDGILTIV